MNARTPPGSLRPHTRRLATDRSRPKGAVGGARVRSQSLIFYQRTARAVKGPWCMDQPAIASRSRAAPGTRASRSSASACGRAACAGLIAEQARRAMRALDASVRLAERGLDVTASDHVERLDGGRRSGRRRARADDAFGVSAPWPRAAGDVELAPLSEEHRAVHHGRHLSDVPRPSILGEHADIVVRRPARRAGRTGSRRARRSTRRTRGCRSGGRAAAG